MEPTRLNLFRLAIAIGIFGCAMILLALPPAGRASASAPSGLASYVTATFPVATEATYEVPGRGARTITLEGIATVLFDRYVLTVAHAVSRARLEEGIRYSEQSAGIPHAARSFQESTYLLLPAGRAPLEPLVRNEEVDVALFELPRDVSTPALPCAIGDSDALRLGGPVLLVERDVVAGPLVRPAGGSARRLIAQPKIPMAMARRKRLSRVGSMASPGGTARRIEDARAPRPQDGFWSGFRQ